MRPPNRWGGLRPVPLVWPAGFEKFVALILGALGEVVFPGLFLMRYAVIVVGLVSSVTAIQRLMFTYRSLNTKE